MKNLSSILFLLVLIVALSGCNTTQGIGHLNPEYSDYKITNVAIYVDNTGDSARMIEQGVVESLNGKGIQAVGVRNYAQFSKSHEDFVEKVWGLGVEEVLAMSLSDSTGSTTVGYQSFGSVNVYGNQANITSMTTPMNALSRAIRIDAKLYNVEGDIVWAGEAKREASGLAFVGDGSMANNAVSAVMEALESSQIIQ